MIRKRPKRRMLIRQLMKKFRYLHSSSSATAETKEQAAEKMTIAKDYALKKTIVEANWERYQLKKDPIWLAEICAKLPFYGNPQVGEEIRRLLQKKVRKINDIDDQIMRQDIYRLWNLWKGSEDDIMIRQKIGDIFYGEDRKSSAERVRKIIEKFQALENGEPPVSND